MTDKYKEAIGLDYKNKFGSLTLAPIGAYKPISTIHSRDLSDADGVFFSLEDAEKIALITGNRRIQIVPVGKDFEKFFVIHHESPSSGAVCKVEKLVYDFKMPEPAKAIADSFPRPYGM